MTTPQQVQWLKLLMDKDMTSARWMALVANLAFVAMLDVNSDLSNPDAVFAALGVEMVPFGEPMKLPAHTRFVAVEKFIKNTGADAELPISNIEKNFREHFLGVDEKVIKPSTLKKFRLLKLSLGMRILNILGCTKEKTGGRC